MTRLSARTYQGLATAFAFAVVLFFLEHTISSAIVAALQGNNTSFLSLMGWTLPLRLAANSGFVFSLPLPPAVIYIISAALLLALSRAFVLASSSYPPSLVFAYALILAGAASNLLARIQQGFVWDYIVFRFLKLEGVWNLADIFILAGAVLWGSCMKHKT